MAQDDVTFETVRKAARSAMVSATTVLELLDQLEAREKVRREEAKAQQGEVLRERNELIATQRGNCDRLVADMQAQQAELAALREEHKAFEKLGLTKAKSKKGS